MGENKFTHKLAGSSVRARLNQLARFVVVTLQHSRLTQERQRESVVWLRGERRL